MKIKYVITPNGKNSKEFVVDINTPVDYFSIQENNTSVMISFKTRDLSKDFVLQALGLVENYDENTAIEVFDDENNISLGSLKSPTTLTVTTSADIDHLTRIVVFSSVRE